MEIKKEYSYSKGRQIWRLIPTDTEKLVIEDRNTDTREVFFNCLDINSGKTIFDDLQLDEKFWIGIESVNNDIIYFHKFIKPDMPAHNGIIAFDIIANKILWQNDSYAFLFILEDKLYCYQSTFEGKHFFLLNCKTGEVVEDIGEDAAKINLLREKSFSIINYENYLFPEPFNPETGRNSNMEKYISELKAEHTVAGRIEHINTGDALLFNYHEVLPDGNLCNRFKAIDIFAEKIIFEETLNHNTKVFVPDSFFIKDKLIFLLKEKNNLTVCSFNH